MLQKRKRDRTRAEESRLRDGQERMSHREARNQDCAARKGMKATSSAMAMQTESEQRDRDRKRKRSLQAERKAEVAELASGNIPDHSPMASPFNHIKVSHNFDAFKDLPNELSLAQDLRNRAGLIGLHVADESVSYIFYAMHEYITRILEICKRLHGSTEATQVLTMQDMRDAAVELQILLPPWNMCKLWNMMSVVD